MEIRLCRPEEEEASWQLEREVWNPFNWEARGGAGTDYFPELHLLAFVDGKMAGTIDGCPMHWDGDPDNLPGGGWTEMVRAAHLFRAGKGRTDEPNWVGAIGTSILPEYSGQGLSKDLLLALRAEVAARGYEGMAAPVRPVFRPKAPWATISEYALLRLPDGRHFDPWVRVHEDIGGKIEGVAPLSAMFQGSREEWEKWTGIKLPGDGLFALPETIGPLEMSGGVGTLREESLWLVHR